MGYSFCLVSLKTTLNEISLKYHLSTKKYICNVEIIFFKENCFETGSGMTLFQVLGTGQDKSLFYTGTLYGDINFLNLYQS